MAKHCGFSLCNQLVRIILAPPPSAALGCRNLIRSIVTKVGTSQPFDDWIENSTGHQSTIYEQWPKSNNWVRDTADPNPNAKRRGGGDYVGKARSVCGAAIQGSLLSFGLDFSTWAGLHTYPMNPAPHPRSERDPAIPTFPISDGGVAEMQRLEISEQSHANMSLTRRMSLFSPHPLHIACRNVT